MYFKELSNELNFKLQFYIYMGISNEIEHLNTSDKDATKIIKDLLAWYKKDILVSYNSLEKQFNEVMNNGK